MFDSATWRVPEVCHHYGIEQSIVRFRTHLCGLFIGIDNKTEGEAMVRFRGSSRKRIPE